MTVQNLGTEGDGASTSPADAGQDDDTGRVALVGDLGVILPGADSPLLNSAPVPPPAAVPPPIVGNTSPFVINVTYDQSVNSLPAGFVAAVNYVVSYYESIFTSATTVNIDVGFGEIAGQAMAPGALGESETFLSSYSYSTVRNAMASVNPAAAATMPSSMPVSGTMWVPTSEARALGLSVPATSFDGYAGFTNAVPFTYDPNNRAVAGAYDFIGVVAHEFSEIMGRIDLFGASIGGTTGYTPLDMFHYVAAGVHTYTGQATNYFSVDGGITNLDNFNTTPGGDLGDWASSAGNDAYLAFSSSGRANTVSQTDITEMNALGYRTGPLVGITVSGTTLEAIQGGATPLTLLKGPATITDSTSATLSSATIKIANGSGGAVSGDSLFVNGALGNGVTASWNAGASTLTLTGAASLSTYASALGEIAYLDAGVDTTTVGHAVRTVTWTVSDGTNSFGTTSQVTIDRLPVANSDSASDAAGATITTTAATGVLSNDIDADGDSLAVTGVRNTVSGTGVVGQLLAGAYGQFVVIANGAYSYVANNTAAISSAPTGSHLVDSFTYAVGDGNGGQATTTLAITIDRAPVVTASNITAVHGQTSFAAANLFTVSDPDGDPIASYQFYDASGSGHFVVNGVAQAASTIITVTAAQLAQTTYQVGRGERTSFTCRRRTGRCGAAGRAS